MTKAQLESLCIELLEVVNSTCFSDTLGRAMMEEVGQELASRYCDDNEWILSREREKNYDFVPSKTQYIDDRYLVERTGAKWVEPGSCPTCGQLAKSPPVCYPNQCAIASFNELSK